MLRGVCQHLGGGHARPNADRPLGGIDHDLLQPRKVDDKTVVDAPPHKAVTPRTDRQLETMLPSEVYAAGNIVVVLAAYEHGGAPIRRWVPPGHTPRLVVLTIGWDDHAAREARAEASEVIGIDWRNRPLKSLTATAEGYRSTGEDRRFDELSTCAHAKILEKPVTNKLLGPRWQFLPKDAAHPGQGGLLSICPGRNRSI